MSLERLTGDLFAALRPTMLRAMQAHREEWIETDLNLWLTSDRPTTFDLGLLPGEQFVVNLFLQVREIMESFEVMQDIEFYLRSYPYRSAKLSRVRHLRYHSDNHLHEIYVLYNRLKAFTTRICRMYRSDPRCREIEERSETLLTALVNGFGALNLRRSRQVHEARIRDRTHRSLISLEFYSKQVDNRKLRILYDGRYHRLRADRVQEIRKLNRLLQQVLDGYFGALYPIIFDSRCNVIVPKKII